MAVSQKNVATRKNSLASTFTSCPRPVRCVTGGAIALQGVGRDRVRRHARSAQRLGLPEGVGRSDLLQRGEVLLESVLGDDPHLEVHLRVVCAAELGAAA